MFASVLARMCALYAQSTTTKLNLSVQKKTKTQALSVFVY